ncbi:MAG: AmmeMemoRadiSam system protein B [Deltaproteobacteria bacterium]|nr:AmmeMemoRadiSam system protein B [Deltaproteobacteria bacterium]
MELGKVIRLTGVTILMLAWSSMAALNEAASAGPSEENIRAPILAGTWYPSDQPTLARAVDGYLDAAGPISEPGHIYGILTPHAGYAYSGPVAGHAFKAVQGQQYKHVILIGPSHRVPFEGTSIFDGSGFRTPLGVVPVNRDLVKSLVAASTRIKAYPPAHAEEHSVEIEIPFVQRTLPQADIVPLVMGSQDLPACRELAAALVKTIKAAGAVSSTLIVASSDLSHFHDYSRAVTLDQMLLNAVRQYQPVSLSADLTSGKVEACGGGPLVTAMLACAELGADRADVLKYANSGDVTGDKTRVVGYAAAAFWRSTDPVAAGKTQPGSPSPKKQEKNVMTENKEPKSTQPGSEEEYLTPSEKEFLLAWARKNVAAAVKGESLPKPEIPSAKLEKPGAAFVTLEKKGKLRGCIGYVVARAPLYKCIQDMAVAASLHDPRFPAVQPDELSDLDLEISVLTPMKQVTDISTIKVGRDGLMIFKGGRSGLLLPQVAERYGWTSTQFLEQTCEKAGLPPDAWKEGADIYSFSAVIWGDHKP